MNRQSERRSLTGATQFRAAEENDQPVIEGYFAVFDSNYEIYPGATESIDRAAFDGQLDGDVRALIDHETRLVLGRTIVHTLELRTDTHGLWGKILVNREDADAMSLYARVKRGDVSQCSFGFDITEEEYSVDERTGNVHWTIKAVELYEVSVCTFPAYEATQVSARKKQAEGIKKRQVEAWRQEMTRRIKRC